MGSYQNPVGGSRDPYEKLRVEPIEEDKLTKEDRPKRPAEEAPPEKVGTLAYLLQTLRNVVTFFLVAPQGAASREMRDTLLLLKASFEILKREDRSQDIGFLNKLSHIWLEVLEGALHPHRDSPIAEKTKSLIKKIQHYPERHPHTLGYYLSEYAGQKWIPFPYMELIQKLHLDHEKNPPLSALTEWTSLIDGILSLLKID